MASSHDPAGRDWLGLLPDDVVLLVCKDLPPGPVGCGDFRQLSQRCRRLANSTVTNARVEDWNAAALMGTTFPQLEELIVWSPNEEGAQAFLQHSAPQLTRLVSLEAPMYSLVSVQRMEQLRSGMPRLRRLSLGRLQLAGVPGAPHPVLEVIRCIVQLDQLTSLTFGAVDAPKEALALLQGLPNLHSLDLEDSNLQDEQLAGLEGLTGLGALILNHNAGITDSGLQALLPRLLLLTSLELLLVDFSEEGFQLLAKLPGLRHLGVAPYNSVYGGITELTQLQHLSMLVAPGWKVECNEQQVWALLCSSSLRVVHVCSVSEEAAGPQVCQVTELQASTLGRSMPLLPKLSRLVVSSLVTDQMTALLQHTTITELVLFGVHELVAADLRCLAQLPQLRALTLRLRSTQHLALSDAVLPLAQGRCTGLERLTLSGLDDLTDQGLEGVALGLPSLHSLEVQRCPATTAEGRERVLRLVAQAAAARGC